MRPSPVVVAVAVVFAAAIIAPPASALPIVPLSKSVVAALGGDIVDAGWRRCWRDRWGRRHCQWCWRDRWGRVICR